MAPCIILSEEWHNLPICRRLKHSFSLPRLAVLHSSPLCEDAQFGVFLLPQSCSTIKQIWNIKVLYAEMDEIMIYDTCFMKETNDKNILTCTLYPVKMSASEACKKVRHFSNMSSSVLLEITCAPTMGKHPPRVKTFWTIGPLLSP